MSTISIHYTPAFSSDPGTSSPFICHRICYRFNATGAYCCIEDSTASLAGVPKIFTFTVADAPCGAVPPVDVDACTIPAYDGYVQACCETEGTFDGAEFFSAVFTPDPECVNVLTCCIANQPLDASYFDVTHTGSLYVLAPTVTIVRDPFDPVAAGGTNDAVVTANLTGDLVTSFTVSTPGLYGKIPTVVIASPPAASPSGTTAEAILIIPCTGTTDEYWMDCLGDASPSGVVDILLGECVNHCYPEQYPYVYDNVGLADPPDTSNFSYEPGGCCDCSTCRAYEVLVSSDQPGLNIVYTSCSNPDGSPAEVSQMVLLSDESPSGTIIIACAIPGSIYCTNDPNAIISITDTGVCATCP